MLRGLVLAVAMWCGLAASAAHAAVTFDSATFDWTFRLAPAGTTGSDETLALGPNRISISQYNLTCFEEGCDGLRFGGSTGTSVWDMSLLENSLSYVHTAFQGSDDGASAREGYVLEAVFRSLRPLKIASHETRAITSVICGDCVSHITASTSLWTDAGMYFASVLIVGDAFVANGDQRIDHRFTARVAEVPEPSTWALLIAGFGIVGAALRATRAASGGDDRPHASFSLGEPSKRAL